MHGIDNSGSVDPVFMEVQCGGCLAEDDIQGIEDGYDEG
ncbi:MAG: hypothetical protein KAY24_00640 [Candidatus Eisenbacteria sp.]|nr:hypothetical protein [Candidatus Eisenbacteria bacterium]